MWEPWLLGDSSLESMDRQKHSASGAPKESESTELALTQWEGFVCEVKRRSELKAAPYNPRRITDAAREKLRKGIKKLKLLGPVQWNKRTGNVVGGHQRLRILDKLENRPDYLLTVAVNDLDDKEEKEANLLLNNWTAQGEFDDELIKEILPGLDLDATGFDDGDIMRMLGTQFQSDELEKLEEMAERVRHAREVVAASAAVGDRYNDVQFYFVVTFKSTEEAMACLQELGLEANRFQSGEKLREIFRMRKTGEATAAE